MGILSALNLFSNCEWARIWCLCVACQRPSLADNVPNAVRCASVCFRDGGSLLGLWQCEGQSGLNPVPRVPLSPMGANAEQCVAPCGPLLVSNVGNAGLFDTNIAHSRLFLAIFGPFLGHIVELEGKKGLLVTGQSRRTSSVGTVSLRLAVLSGFGGRLGPKKAVLGHKMRNFGKAPPDLPAPSRGATGDFWLKPWIWQGPHLGSRIARVDESPER